MWIIQLLMISEKGELNVRVSVCVSACVRARTNACVWVRGCPRGRGRLCVPLRECPDRVRLCSVPLVFRSACVEPRSRLVGSLTPCSSPIRLSIHPSVHPSISPESVHASLRNLLFSLFRRREPKTNLALAGQPVPRSSPDGGSQRFAHLQADTGAKGRPPARRELGLLASSSWLLVPSWWLRPLDPHGHSF